MNIHKMFFMTALAGIVMALYANPAFASSTASAASTTVSHVTSAQYIAHKCGGPANNDAQLLGNWGLQGILDDEGHAHGLRAVDESTITYVKDSVNVFTLARTATVNDNGCKDGKTIGVGTTTLKPGTSVFGDHTTLNAKYGKGGWSPMAHPGWNKLAVQINSTAMTTCSNPISGPIWVWIWVPPVHHTKVVARKATGSCSFSGTVKNSPGTVINICGKVITTKCSQTGGIKNTINCEASKPATKKSGANVFVRKCLTNWTGRVNFVVSTKVNGKLRKTQSVPSTCQWVAVGKAPKGSTVSMTENLKASVPVAGDAWQQVRHTSPKKVGNSPVYFTFVNQLLSLIHIAKFTQVGTTSTSCTAPCATSESFLFGMSGGGSNWKFQLPNDGLYHGYYGVVGVIYTVTELEGHGYTVSNYPVANGVAGTQVFAAASPSFKLAATGYQLVFLNQRSAPNQPTSPPTTTTTPTPSCTPPLTLNVNGVCVALKGSALQIPPQPAVPGTPGVSPPDPDPGPGATPVGPAGGSAGSSGGGGGLPVPTPGVGGY